MIINNIDLIVVYFLLYAMIIEVLLKVNLKKNY
jgi:hypothetical protein